MGRLQTQQQPAGLLPWKDVHYCTAKDRPAQCQQGDNMLQEHARHYSDQQEDCSGDAIGSTGGHELVSCGAATELAQCEGAITQGVEAQWVAVGGEGVRLVSEAWRALCACMVVLQPT